MSGTEILLIEGKRKEIDIKVHIKVEHMDISFEEYAKDLNELKKKTENSSIFHILSGLAEIIEQLWFFTFP